MNSTEKFFNIVHWLTEGSESTVIINWLTSA